MKGTVFSCGATNTTRIMSTKMYPTTKDKQVESGEIDQTMNLIDKYLDQVIQYIQMNRVRSNLEKADHSKL